jgi:hypothetical protein
MTNEHSEQPEQPQAQEPDTPQTDWTQPDWFLQTLVNLANTGDGNIEIGMTLLVGGFLVSGKMVGGGKYFDGFARDLASSLADQTNAEKIRTSFSQFGEIYKTDAVNPPSTAYVHLMEARFFNTAGNPIPANRGVWWRGRLAEVSGFMIGILGHG